MFYFKVEEGQGKVTLDICLQSNLQTQSGQLNLELRQTTPLILVPATIRFKHKSDIDSMY